MRRILKVIVNCLLILFSAFVIFYFWAKQGMQPNSLQLISHPENKVENHDSIIGFLTYNMGYLSGMDNNLAIKTLESTYTKNLQKVIDELEKLHPDIVAFQEIDYHSNRSYKINQHEEIASRFYPHSVEAINWDKRYVPFPYWPPSVHFGRMLSGQSTMSLWELQRAERLVLKEVETNPFYYNAFYLERLAVSTLVKHPLRDFWLINVHTEAFDKATRKLQIETLHKLFKKKLTEYPVVMLGDFNSSPDYENTAIEPFLNDSAIGCAAFTPANYANSFPSENPVERLDYIFYSKPNFEELEGEVFNTFGTASDHLPVYAKLKMK